MGGRLYQNLKNVQFNTTWYDRMIRVAKAADSLGVQLSTPIDGNLTTKRWWENLINNKLENK